MFSEFKAFLTKSNAMALAIGIIIGVAMGVMVNSLVKDIIMPPISLILAGIDFSSLKIVLKDTGDPATQVAIRYGAFLLTVVQFVVIALVVFWIGRLLIKEEPEAPAGPSEEARLLAEIRDELRKG